MQNMIPLIHFESIEKAFLTDHGDSVYKERLA